MVYLSLISAASLLVFLYLHAFNTRRRTKELDKIRATWSVGKKEDFNFNRISRYAELSINETPHKLSQQTLNDIDFEQLFAFIDRTTSRVGQQFLFRQVIHPFASIEDLKKLDTLANTLASNPSQREEIQKDLIKLAHHGAYNICNVLTLRVSAKPGWFKYLYVNIIVLVTLAVLAFAFPVCLILLLVPLTINTIVHYWNKGNIIGPFSSFPELSTLMQVAESILQKPGFANSMVKESLQDLKAFRRQLQFINPEASTTQNEFNQLTHYLSELIKAMLLIEVFATFSVGKRIAKNRASISAVFDFVGSVDTAISIAALRNSCPGTCEPRFVETTKEMHAKGIYHPLIRKCVRNDIVIHNKSVLITGSNMSGKTTFLRTFVINSILAQSIFTCFATEFTTPFVRQFSSIRINDSLFDGHSYFFEEVNVIGLFIEEMQTSYQNLFILDEVFKGTNSFERSALAKAILSYLDRGNNIVMVSTHDLELAAMLKEQYDVYHFSETINNGELHFDHVLKAGPLKTGNAIRLLELGNFPDDIIKEAKMLSSDLDRESDF
jgi:DNA mismatch repair ATPase MutS